MASRGGILKKESFNMPLTVDTTNIRIRYTPISNTCPVFRDLENIKKFFSCLPPDAQIVSIVEDTDKMLIVKVASALWPPGVPDMFTVRVKLRTDVDVSIT